MPIGPKKLLELVRQIKLVTNLDRRELTNPEGAGFDLRVGEVYKISGRGFLGVGERQTPSAKLVASFVEGKKTSVKIKPGDFFLIKTAERVNLPINLTGHTFSRTTLFRSGLFLLTSQTPPGYQGELVFGLVNVGPAVVALELGARIAHIQFEKVEGGGAAYRGQWQGGRVAATKKEKQV